MAKTITGNKGEWSEMYVLFRLLSQGKIHAADENVEKIEDIFFPILKCFGKMSLVLTMYFFYNIL